MEGTQRHFLSGDLPARPPLPLVLLGAFLHHLALIFLGIGVLLAPRSGRPTLEELGGWSAVFWTLPSAQAGRRARRRAEVGVARRWDHTGGRSRNVWEEVGDPLPPPTCPHSPHASGLPRVVSAVTAESMQPLTPTTTPLAPRRPTASEPW